jgi:hypothetical protein
VLKEEVVVNDSCGLRCNRVWVYLVSELFPGGEGEATPWTEDARHFVNGGSLVGDHL